MRPVGAESSRGSWMDESRERGRRGDRSGRPVPLEDYLDEIFERIVDRFERGERPEPGEYIGEYPDDAEAIEEAFRLAQQVAFGGHARYPQVPGFTIVSEIGVGGMGAVYVARQDRLGGRLVALKVLPEAHALSARARDRFRMESAAVARLRHPHIVSVFDVVEAPGVYAYAMELVDGASLADHIRDAGRTRAARPWRARAGRPPCDPDFCCRLGVAIARALQTAHEAGVLHRDVKPSNILLRADGTVLLADFGLARDSSSAVRTEPGQFVGTVAYAAPEQLRGAHVDARSDVYALGATLYHALSGRLPWAGATPHHILREMEERPPPRLREWVAGVPRDLETVVAKAMDVEPERRYALAGALADDLQRVLDHRPIGARPAGPLARAFKGARRNRRWLTGAMAGVLVMLVAVGIGVAWWAVLPALSARSIREARLALLDPAQADAWLAGSLLGERQRHGDLPDRSLDNALERYATASRYLRLAREERLEREAVRIARAVRLGSPVVTADWFARAAPSTAAYASSRVAGRPADLDDLPSADSRLDRRTLGLLAFLCGDMLGAIRAWEDLPTEDEPDPFIELALGQIALATDQPARALACYRSAYRAFGRVGYICVDYADAAVRCDDLALAERLLARAEHLRGHDSMLTSNRVRADLDARRAERLRAEDRTAEADALDAAARTRFEYFRRQRVNGPARDRYGQFLTRRGELREAAQVYAEIVRLYPSVAHYREKFRDSADRWWGSLSVPERARELRRMLDGDPYLFEFLFLYHGGLGPAMELRDRPSRRPDRATPDAYLASISLEELGRRVRILDVPRWGHSNEFPTWLRAALVGLWSAPLPEWIADTAIAIGARGAVHEDQGTPSATYRTGFDGPSMPPELEVLALPAGRAEVVDGALCLTAEAGQHARHHGARVHTRFTLEGDFVMSARVVRRAGGGVQSLGLAGLEASASLSRGGAPGGAIRLPRDRLMMAWVREAGPFDSLRVRRVGRILLTEARDPTRGWVRANIAFGEGALIPVRAVLSFAVTAPVGVADACAFDDWEIRAERLVFDAVPSVP